MTSSRELPIQSAPTIIDQIYAIIDSKLQYIDYQTSNLFNLLNNTSAKAAPKDKIEPVSESATSNKGALNDIMLVQIEKTSKLKSLLLFLRTNLCLENAKTIFCLLSNNEFQRYNEKSLEKIISA